MSLSSESSLKQALSPLVASVCSAIESFTDCSSTFSLPSPHFVVAFSGGVDSTVLLHAMVRLRDAGVIHSLSAIHVHHGLSINADSWAEHCEHLCRQWQVPLTVRQVDISEASGDGVEQAARVMRYRVFEECLSEQGCLLQGHHRDDQAETLLFRLFRGSGLDGLAGIPVNRSLGTGQLLRPLLSVSKAAIEAYAAEYQLGHIEDESNTDQRFARNYLRQSLVPEIERRWPGVSERLAALSREVQAVQESMQQAVTAAAESVLVAAPAYWNAGQVIQIDSLLALPDHMAMRVVRYWLKQKGLLMPDRSLLETLLTEVVHCREDAEPEMKLGDYAIRRFSGYLVLVPVLQPFGTAVIEWACEDQPELMVPASGRIVLSDNVARRFKTVSVRFRHNLPESSKIRVAGRQGSKSVKRWLQDYRVPPWLRDRVPFLYFNDEMVCAAGLWQCDSEALNRQGTPLDINAISIVAYWQFDPYEGRY
ncbi:hypothetical protein GZ77_04955 [Endozoicomonas montiporae]|uniref:tRNA(Ile)-lysidine synthase n=2 Tax=Endozoicomonas montiporae TaxID=1027273 RepID=A0A081NBP3_9GAMM|nr:tRNA lysidine(34) synthetase TilS [Endozoicomonas montiporae]AMO56162.1 tRNA(Ile)-lysidine synthetase [Endozoicomonas montiporae CL-33]KEQ15866.1 hypothetical protein GZ77_04955 [Endozoicomonas montiporae]